MLIVACQKGKKQQQIKQINASENGADGMDVAQLLIMFMQHYRGTLWVPENSY